MHGKKAKLAAPPVPADWLSPSRIWRALGGRRRQAAAFLALAVLAALLEGVGLSMIIPLVDAVLNEQPTSGIGRRIAGFFGDAPETLIFASTLAFSVTLILKEIFVLWRESFSVRFGARMRNDWRIAIAEGVLFSEEGALDEKRRGAVIELLVTQTQLASKFLKTAVIMINDALFATVMAIVLFSVAFWPSLALMVLFGLVFGISHLAIRPMTDRIGRRLLDVALSVSATASELLSGLREMKVLSQEKVVLGELERLNEEQANLLVRSAVLNKAPSAIGTLVVTMLVFGAIVVAVLTPSIELTTVLPIASLFVFVGQRMSNHISAIAGKWVLLRTSYPAFALVTRTVAGLECPSRKETVGRVLAWETAPVVFEGVCFDYDPEAALLRNVNLRFDPGRITALIGPSGSGKSTIADLLLALRKPRAGRILVGDTDLASLDPRDWRQSCAVVPQNPFLFNRSVLENIAIARPEASEEEIRAAAKQAYALDFIENLSDGFDTVVGDAGSNLSGGQAQRVTIARALLRDPLLVVFDEPTSALDAAGRDRFRTTLRDLAARGKIVIVITHDPAVSEDADTRYHLRRDADGRTSVSTEDRALAVNNST